MKRAIILAGSLLLGLGTVFSQTTTDYTQYVDPFIGADGGGYTFPGPARPAGIVKLGPDCNKLTENAGWDPAGLIQGFSHTHINGSGGGCKYGNVLFMPTVGEVKTEGYGSERGEEYAEVGLYTTTLETYGIGVRLSATQHAGIHEYTFPETDQANVLMDMGSFLSSYERQEFVGSEIRIISDTEVEGYTRIRGGWNIGTAYTVYFYAKFDTPAESMGTWKSGRKAEGMTSQYDSNEKTGAWMTFNTNGDRTVKVKVGISWTGCNKARHNAGEIKGWDLDAVKDEAKAEWNRILSLVNIEGGTDEQKRIFYSSLYRIFLQPVDYTDENPVWKTDKPYYGDYHAIWDTFRTTHPFINLMKPSLGADLVESLVDIYRYDYYMPDARTSHDTGRTQGGSNSDMLVADAFVKGLDGIDYETALEAMIKNATVPPGDDERKWGRGGLVDYNSIGYVSTDYERGVTRTFEYCPNDWAIATVAKGLGRMDIYEKYKAQASRWENLWNDGMESFGFKGFAWPRNHDGSWYSDPEYTVFSSGSLDHQFYESFSWEMSFYVPHDMKRLIERMGGPETFEKRLDTYFTESFPGKRDELLYWTKLFGMCQISNEPSFLIPVSYNYINKQHKTAKFVREIMSEMFSDARDGVPGNDDSATMGAWYVWHAMGFYPNAGQDVYLISSPVFEKMEMTLENGRKLVVKAKNASEKNIYVQSVTLNGKPLKNNWFRHSDIADGAVFEFVMGSRPSDWDRDGVLPPSMSDIE